MNLKYWIIGLLMLPLLAACDNEDDVDAIFYGKTWKLTSVMKDSKTNYYGNYSDEQKEIAASGSDSYYITFTTTQFSGKTSTGSFSGTYTVDGDSRKLSFSFSKSSSDSNTVSAMMMDILKNATHYKGDSNTLAIYQDDGPYLLFYPVK